MKLTIAFDDISLPLPQMQAPDIRGRVSTMFISSRHLHSTAE
jgi:hypothetical protein